MNFKTFYNESWDDISNLTIADITKEDMFGPEFIKVWSIVQPPDLHYFLTLDKDNDYEMFDVDGNDLLDDRFDKDPYIAAVKRWEIAHRLSSDTKDTFGDML